MLDLGLDEATVYRYARAFAALGLAKYLAHKQPGYWSLLTSAQLAHLCQEVNTQLYTDSKDVQTWLLRTYRVAYSRSGLTDLLHRLGFTYTLTTPVINTTFYRTKVQFRAAVLDFFDRLPASSQDLASLLTRKFHVLDAQPTS